MFYAGYSVVRDIRGTKPVSRLQALHNAHRVISVERVFGIFQEQRLQHLFVGDRLFIEFWDDFYGSAHFVITLGVLVGCSGGHRVATPVAQHLGVHDGPGPHRVRLFPAHAATAVARQSTTSSTPCSPSAVCGPSPRDRSPRSPTSTRPCRAFTSPGRRGVRSCCSPALRRRWTRVVVIAYPVADPVLHRRDRQPLFPGRRSAAPWPSASASPWPDLSRATDSRSRVPGQSPTPGRRHPPDRGARAPPLSPDARDDGRAAGRARRTSWPRSWSRWTPASPLCSTPSRPGGPRWMPTWCDPLAALRPLVMAGGKRLRPAFCSLGVRRTRRRSRRPAGRRRRGRPRDAPRLRPHPRRRDRPVGPAPRRRHPARSLRPPACRGRLAGRRPRFGEGVAILVGDLALVYADLLLGRVPAVAAEVFDELRVEVNMGQYLDLLGSARHDASPALARRICRYKSAKYTVERPLHLGAALADPERLAQAGRTVVGLRAAARRGVPADRRPPRGVRGHRRSPASRSARTSGRASRPCCTPWPGTPPPAPTPGCSSERFGAA